MQSMLMGQNTEEISLLPDTDNLEYHHDIGINAGYFSAEGFFIMVFAKGIPLAIVSSINKHAYRFDWVGSYSFNYYYRLKPWCELGFKVVYEGIYNTIYTDSTRSVKEKTYTTSSLAIMPSARFIYLNKPVVKLYSGIDLGMNVMWDGKKAGEDAFHQCMFAFDVIPIGVMVGKKWYGLLETNIGVDALVKIGVGYRFK